jgi:predicted dehydrogenase
MAEQIKWGILGNANIARVCVIPAIQKSRNGTVHALATRSPEHAKEMAVKNNIGHVYDSYDRLIMDPAVDAVYIPLPNHLHYPWTLKALGAGKHVLCEKPLACSAREAEEMTTAATERGLLLMEAFMYRFHPRSRRIKQMVDEGEIGKVCLVRAAFCYHMDDETLSSGENARLKPEMGGGALLDVGCYSVSLARWLLGEEPEQGQSQAVYHPGEVDIHAVALLRFPGGVLATLEASFISALQQTYTIVGTEGVIELPHDAFIPWEKDTVFTLRGEDQEVGQQYITPGADEYQVMVEDFGDAVLGKTELPFSPSDSIGNMRVLDALAEAARSGRTVKL